MEKNNKKMFINREYQTEIVAVFLSDYETTKELLGLQKINGDNFATKSHELIIDFIKDFHKAYKNKPTLTEVLYWCEVELNVVERIFVKDELLKVFAKIVEMSFQREKYIVTTLHTFIKKQAIERLELQKVAMEKELEKM